jgi:hypothetical protein
VRESAPKMLEVYDPLSGVECLAILIKFGILISLL